MLATRTTGGVITIAVTAGGSGYTAPPAVALSGGGGSGVTAVAHMAGTAVESVIITNAGTGYTSSPTVAFSGGGGTGAAAGASVYAGSFRPMSFFQGRDNDVYGVDGMGRGIRITGGTAIPIGVQKPGLAPAVTAASTVSRQYVEDIVVTRQGAGYIGTPTVALTGGSAARAAKAQAEIRNGRLVGGSLLDKGDGYQSQPSVTISGGFPTAPTFGVEVFGGVDRISVVNSGSGYSTDLPPSVVFAGGGLTGANARAIVDESGRVAFVEVLATGFAATTAATASLTALTGSGGQLSVDMVYSVNAITTLTTGSSHFVPPTLTIVPATSDTIGGGGVAAATINSSGNVTGVTVVAGGLYRLPPTCVVEDTSAQATARLAPRLRGKYLCAIRYIDESRDPPIPSSISDTTEVEIPDGSDSLQWSFTHSAVDDRVTAVELWRTSANQSVVLFRVATISRQAGAWTSGYSDTLSEPDLTDVNRIGYGLLPITLPSGQLNARRFGVPPANYAVACMFQDRAWYAVDTTGQRPNSLLYSEIDEPESVPLENELLLQESAGELDAIAALIPMSAELVVAQTGHLYSLRYVAQPLLDASVTLVAYRGILNPRCWTSMGGVVFLADSYGIYAYDGQKEQPLSVQIDDLWRGTIDFSKSHLFHMSSDYNTKVIRFHYCKAADSLPTRALCFCLATEAWWEEEYPAAVTASAPAVVGGKRVRVFGTAAGAFVKESPGQADASGAVAWSYRSGNLPLNKGPSRSIGVVYTPTAGDCDLTVGLHYNGSATSTPPAITSRPGTGFESDGTALKLNMKSTRSPLGDATGYAEAMLAGRLDPRSSGADRHMAVAFAGTHGPNVQIHSVNLEGTG